MRTEHRHLCVYRCVQKRQFSLHKLLVSVNTVYETVLCPLCTNSQQQGCTGEPTDVITLIVGSECMHVMKQKKLHAAEMCSAFIPGL